MLIQPPVGLFDSFIFTLQEFARELANVTEVMGTIKLAEAEAYRRSQQTWLGSLLCCLPLWYGASVEDPDVERRRSHAPLKTSPQKPLRNRLCECCTSFPMNGSIINFLARSSYSIPIAETGEKISFPEDPTSCAQYYTYASKEHVILDRKAKTDFLEIWSSPEADRPQICNQMRHRNCA